MGELFTAPDAWSGGSFEILMFLGRVDSSYVQEFLGALWGLPHVEGCWLDRTVEPDDRSRVHPSAVDLESHSALFGLVELPNGCRCPCSSYLVDDDNGFWVYFGMPLGSLGTCYPVGAYPFEEGSDQTWVAELSEWLADMGRELYGQQPGQKPFRGAVTGFLTMTEVQQLLTGDVPQKRWNGYLIQGDHELKWYGPNASTAPMTIDRSRTSAWSRISPPWRHRRQRGS